MEYSERYTTDPFKDENLSQEDTEEYELLRNLYYYLMVHGKVNETFAVWINKNKGNLDAVIDQAKNMKGHEGKFHSYLKS